MTTGRAASGDTGDGDAELDALIEAAQDEGSVMLYWNPSEESATALLEEFSDQYGVSTDFVRLGNSDLAARFDGEAEAGGGSADVVAFSDPLIVGDQIERGWVTPLSEAGVPGFPGDFPEEHVSEDPDTAAIGISPWVIAYNTDDVAEDDLPMTFEDLADPAWEGRIGMPRPDISSPFTQFWQVMADEYGEDYIQAIAEHDPRYFDSAVPLSQALAAGEVDIAFPTTASINAAVEDQGAPIDWVTPEHNTGTDVIVGVASDAPHPNAARLLTHFLLSEAGTEILADHGFASPYGPSLPGQFVRSDFEAAEAFKPRLTELFGF